MNCLDLCTGIGGFALSAERLNWNCIGFAEINPYASKVLDQHFDTPNFHDVTQVGLPQDLLGVQDIIDQDLVPSEELGREFATYEDFMEGVLELPDLVCAGSPCQDFSPASTNNADGINGSKSNLLQNILDFVEDFSPSYFVLENSFNIVNRGLCHVIERLMALGYTVEWETISAAHFGYNHYRHRVYLVAYLNELNTGQSIFDHVAGMACWKPDTKMPLLDNWTQEQLETVYVEPANSIKNRTNRIKALGNAVIPDITYAVFRAIELHKEQSKQSIVAKGQELDCFAMVKISGKPSSFRQMPSRGIASLGKVQALDSCPTLNPSRQTYKGMVPTLMCADGKNNFTTKSRANRPGGLGGTTGAFMKLGVDKGGLSPNFAEGMMGYPKDHTLVA